MYVPIQACPSIHADLFCFVQYTTINQPSCVTVISLCLSLSLSLSCATQIAPNKQTNKHTQTRTARVWGRKKRKRNNLERPSHTQTADFSLDFRIFRLVHETRTVGFAHFLIAYRETIFMKRRILFRWIVINIRRSGIEYFVINHSGLQRHDHRDPDVLTMDGQTNK